MNPPKTRQTSLLIVDDHILFREGLAAMLDGLPDFCVVGQAGSVRSAIEKAMALKPDIILMDVQFSDGSGTDAIKPILASLPRSKIVMLTMYESDELLFSALHHGARGYLLKSVPFSILITSIRALVRGEAALSRSQIGRLLEEFSRLRINGRSSEPVPSALTVREQEVIKELELGATNREIAERLFITENTVKRHIHSILKKLELRSRRDIVKYARKQGL
jgi:two-component system response regulator NreC